MQNHCETHYTHTLGYLCTTDERARTFNWTKTKNRDKKGGGGKITIFVRKIGVSCYLGLLRLLFHYLTMSFVCLSAAAKESARCFYLSKCFRFRFVSFSVSVRVCVCERVCDCYSQMMSWQNYSTCWINTKRVKQPERKNPKRERKNNK